MAVRGRPYLDDMDATLLVSVLALAVSIAAFVYARRATTATEAQARVAQSADRRAREPRLEAQLKGYARQDDSRAWIEITNHGPIDLDDLIVHRPETEDGVRYPVAAMGGDVGDDADVGPIRRLEKRQFALFVGPRGQRPRFVVRATSVAGDDTWDHAFEFDGQSVDVPRVILPTKH